MKALPLILALMLFLAGQLRAETLDDMEAVLKEAGSIDHFLESEDLQNKYYEALSQYFGEAKSKRANYDEFIKQLKQIQLTDAKVLKRLWDTEGTGRSFEVNTSIKTSGRRLDSVKFGAMVQTQYKEWSEKAEPILSIREQGEREAKVTDMLRQLTDSIEGYKAELEAAKMTKKDKAFKYGQFATSLASDSNVVALAAYLNWQHWQSAEVRDHLNTADADLILNLFQSLQEKTDAALHGREAPTEVVKVMKSLFPNPKKLLEDKEMFPEVMKKTRDGKEVPVGTGGAVTYEFKAIPRRFHGIFKGMWLGECLGGGCGWDASANLTGQRWLTVALHNTEFYHVERNGSYLGHIQAVPGRTDKFNYGAPVLSVDFGAPVLAQKAFSLNPDGSIRRSNMFDLWLEAATKNLDPKYRGFVVGRATGGDNAHVLHSTVLPSSHYLMGDSAGTGASFEPLDLGAKGVAGVLKPKGIGTNYSQEGKLVFDATLSNAGDLVLLKVVPEEDMKNPKTILELFKGANEEKTKRLVGLLLQQGRMNAAAYTALAEQVSGALTEEFRSYLIEMLGRTPEATPRIKEVLEQELSSRNERMAASAAAVLARLDAGNEHAVKKVLSLFEQGNFEIFMKDKEIRSILANIQKMQYLPDSYSIGLKKFLKSHAPTRFNLNLRADMIRVLAKHRPEDPDLEPYLLELLGGKTSTPPIQEFALSAISARPLTETAEKALNKALSDENPGVARKAAAALVYAEKENAKAIKILAKGLTDSTYWARKDALQALNRLSERKPELVAPYSPLFVMALSDENILNRQLAKDYVDRVNPRDPNSITAFYSVADEGQQHSQENREHAARIVTEYDPQGKLKPKPAGKPLTQRCREIAGKAYEASLGRILPWGKSE